jgi:hypothetical protein
LKRLVSVGGYTFIVLGLLLLGVTQLYDYAGGADKPNAPLGSRFLPESIPVKDNVHYTLTKAHQSFPDVLFLLGSVFDGRHGAWSFQGCDEAGCHYGYDTHNLVTDVGQNFTQHKLYNVASNNTSTNYRFARNAALTANAGAPAYTDTGCTGEVGGGLARGIMTFTAGVAGSGDVAAVMNRTYTADGTFTAIQKACLFDLSSGGVLYAENTFSSVNMESGDTLALTWTFNHNN